MANWGFWTAVVLGIIGLLAMVWSEMPAADDFEFSGAIAEIGGTLFGATVIALLVDWFLSANQRRAEKRIEHEVWTKVSMELAGAYSTLLNEVSQDAWAKFQNSKNFPMPIENFDDIWERNEKYRQDVRDVSVVYSSALSAPSAIKTRQNLFTFLDVMRDFQIQLDHGVFDDDQ